MESILSLAVIALVKLGQELNEKHWDKVGLILLAALGGGAIGFVTGGVDGIAEGVFKIGLVGSGIITAAGVAGKKAGEARQS